MSCILNAFIYLFKPFFSLWFPYHAFQTYLSSQYLPSTFVTHTPKTKFKHIAKKKKRKEKKNRGMGIVWPSESHSVSLLVFIAVDHWSGSRPLASATL